MKSKQLNTDLFKVQAKQQIRLKNYDPASCNGFANRKEAEHQLKQDIKELADLQYQLYAENKRSVLIVFQAMDAAGKDGSIRHVFSGLNPQGCKVYSFKSPSANELDHDYLWRHYNKLPPRGEIGIFNRSHYENVLITRVHPEFLLNENLPDVHATNDITTEFWERRYRQIRDFEQTLTENGTTIIKFFLHLSKDEQKKRFMERIRKPAKNWKFSSADIRERQYWDDYQHAYEQAMRATSTEEAPWYIIPADNKWFTHVAIGNIIVETLQQMNIQMPEISSEEKDALKKAKKKLQNE
ncbi:polyphosphate kinase 2 family protein [Mangrovibacterium marinum]|uniref:Polyphosphate:AMP phosphotransferase n=1 Tax=Mangrovibacterium marinum TaxID=1639118 RepID=A0A2T5C445_9BACT|nr:polyphosphate kinase 2 family protein [Mangrovibacterium marinum]PTN09595.1 polyphosphate:AMP phosphotransferase [Mangrovibacterium marinum]